MESRDTSEIQTPPYLGAQHYPETSTERVFTGYDQLVLHLVTQRPDVSSDVNETGRAKVRICVVCEHTVTLDHFYLCIN